MNVKRIVYSQHQQASQFSLDADLNLADDQYSDGSRYRLTKEVIRGSFDNAIETMNETTGARIAKRQSLNLIQDVAQDYVQFYKKRPFNKAAKKSKKLNSRLSP